MNAIYRPAVTRRAALRILFTGAGVALLAACTPPAPTPPASVSAVPPTATAPTQPAAAATTPASSPSASPSAVAQAAGGVTSPPEPTLEPGARRGGTFVGVVASDPQTGNRDTNTDLSSFYAFSPLYSALVHTNANREAVPDLAESWTISPDGKRYEFKLRQNATFHDGSPVTSADVQYTVEEVVGKYNALAITIFKNIDHLETPDDHTFVMVVKQPVAVLMLSLAQQNMVILPKRLYQGSDPRTNPTNNAPVGSGPFKFKEWVKGDHITLVRADSYYKSGLPYLDGVTVRVIPDAGSRTLAFQKGDIDFLPGQLVAREQVPQLQSVQGVQIDDHSGPPGQELLFFNTTKKPLDEVRVRTALSMAIDHQAIVERAFFGAGAKPSTSHIEIDLTRFHNPNVKLPALDVAGANQMLDTVGLSRAGGGARFSLGLSYSPGNDSDRRSAELVRDMLSEVGVTVELTPLDQAIITQQVFTDSNFDMFTASVTSNNDPELGKARHYVSSSIGASYGNGSRYSNPDVDQLFSQAAQTIDLDARQTAYYKVQEILARDLPTLPLIDYANIDFHRPEVSGFGTTPLGFPYYRMDNVWRTS
jgi:peptide/nickel transport system substrate-binding protein